MKRQIVVIGLGRLGSAVARELNARGHEVLGIDRSEQRVQDVSEAITHAAVADGADEAALRQLGVGDFDVGIVGLGEEVLTSIMATMALKRIGVKEVVGRAQSELHGEILRRVGADRIVYPERDMGEQLAHSFFSVNIVDYIDLGRDYGVSKVLAPAWFVGQSASDLELRGRYGLTLLAIQRGTEVIMQPRRDETFREGDYLILAGRDDQLDVLLHSHG